MIIRLPADPASGQLEDYAIHFDDVFATLAQRQAFRRYLEGLRLPAERKDADRPGQHRTCCGGAAQGGGGPILEG